MYPPAEGQETIMPFFSVTNHGTFPEYFPEIQREAISFLSKRRDNANMNSKKLLVTVTSTLWILTYFHITLWYVLLYVLLVFVQAFEIN